MDELGFSFEISQRKRFLTTRKLSQKSQILIFLQTLTFVFRILIPHSLPEATSIKNFVNGAKKLLLNCTRH